MIKIGKFLQRELDLAGIDLPPMEIKRGCFDIFGGGGGQPTGTSTTIQSQRPIPVVEDALGTLIPRATELSDIPIEQPDFDTVVPFSTQTEQALQSQEARALGGSPLEQGAQDLIQQTVQGDFLNRVDPSFDQFLQQLTGDVGGAINTQFSQAGRLGSQANAEALGRGITSAVSPLAFQNFSQERQNQLRASELAPGLANIDFQNIAQLGQVGAAREGQQGALLQDQLNRFNFEQEEPGQRLARALALIQGGNFGGTSSTVSPTFSSGNAGLSGALGLASLGNTFLNPKTGIFDTALSGVGNFFKNL